MGSDPSGKGLSGERQKGLDGRQGAGRGEERGRAQKGRYSRRKEGMLQAVRQRTGMKTNRRPDRLTGQTA
ncbi:MAG: hypothetical protein H5T33_06455 [Candidatus Methanosuratus sp.]|nr:hypothetical protein [Candidatus Methanosuratincola sp.]